MGSVATVAQPPSFWMRSKRAIGAILGLIALFVLWFMPAVPNLPPAGQHCLALTVFTVIWWAFTVMNPTFTAIVLLLGFVITGTAPVPVAFHLWSVPLLYMAMGGFLIAAGVEGSGLGNRIAYAYMTKFGKSYGGIIFSCFVLHVILSFLIPQPWPRSLIIMAVMLVVCHASKFTAKQTTAVGFAVFAASIPSSLILLTGDTTINPLVGGFAHINVSWLQWFKYMCVPGVVSCILTYFLHRLLFKGPKTIDINRAEVKAELTKLGPIKRKEWTVMFWIVVAILFWVTDFIHHIDPAWIALGAGVAMALPWVGEVLTVKDWGKVPLGTLMFLTASFSIGFVGGATGMSKWVAGIVLPHAVPSNIIVFVLLVTVVTICIHVCIGSVVATMGFVTPIMVAFTAHTSMSPLVPALLVYTAIYLHYIFPFNNVSILVGVGDQGKYGDAEVMKMGVPLTIIVFIMTVCICLPWWKLLGLF